MRVLDGGVSRVEQPLAPNRKRARRQLLQADGIRLQPGDLLHLLIESPDAPGDIPTDQLQGPIKAHLGGVARRSHQLRVSVTGTGEPDRGGRSGRAAKPREQQREADTVLRQSLARRERWREVCRVRQAPALLSKLRVRVDRRAQALKAFRSRGPGHEPHARS